MAMIQLNIAPTPLSVQGYAGDAVKQMHKVYGFDLDYSVESLRFVDQVLQEWRAGGAPIEAVTKSLYALGSYAGETLRRRIPAHWIEPPEEQTGELNSLFVFIELADGREWRPIAIAFNALMSGAEFSLHKSATALLAG
jgi:hypothetical protein